MSRSFASLFNDFEIVALLRTNMDDQSSRTCTTCGPWWRLPALLALVLVVVVMMRGWGLQETTQSSVEREGNLPTAVAGQTVSTVIDFGGGRRRELVATAWRDGQTVRDMLAAAADTAGSVMFSQQGSGESAFLTEIDGVKNEGADGRNWMYSVNGKLGDRSFAVYKLQAGDKVLWTFAKPQ